MFAFSFYTSHPNYLGNQGCKESFRRLLNLPLVEVSSFVSIPPPSFKVRHLQCYLFFRPPTAHPLPSQELPFVIFQVPLPCGFFTLIALQTCGTHAMINVKLRSLVLIRMSQRNLLWSYSQHWGGCHRYPPPPRDWNASPPTPSGALLNQNVRWLSQVILLNYSKWLLLQTSDLNNLIMSFPGEQLFPVSPLFDSQLNDKIPWANINIVSVFPHLTCILSWLNRWALNILSQRVYRHQSASVS